MSNDHLPHDVLSEILTNPKLSREDIVRCALVCKSWYSLVTSTAFVYLHTTTQQRLASISKNKRNGLFLVIESGTRFSLNLDDDSLSVYKRLEFPLKNPNNFKVVDSLNGVVCLSDNHDNIVLWNPTIRKLLELPKPLVPLDSSVNHWIGFGFDAVTNDFKVVRALSSWQWKISKVLEHAEVYESSVGHWRRIKQDGWSTSGCVSCQLSNQAFLNGFVHWVGERSNQGIVSFDFQNEVFGRMDLPADLLAHRQYWVYNLRVSVMAEESLCLIHHKFSDLRETCSIWVMKEYSVADSWTKLYNIRITNIFPSTSWEIISMRLNVEPLVKNSDEPVLYSYVPDTKQVKHLKLFKSNNFVVVNFTENLALLGVKVGMETHVHGSPSVGVTKKKTKKVSSSTK